MALVPSICVEADGPSAPMDRLDSMILCSTVSFRMRRLTVTGRVWPMLRGKT